MKESRSHSLGWCRRFVAASGPGSGQAGARGHHGLRAFTPGAMQGLGCQLGAVGAVWVAVAHPGAPPACLTLELEMR